MQNEFYVSRVYTLTICGELYINISPSFSIHNIYIVKEVVFKNYLRARYNFIA